MYADGVGAGRIFPPQMNAAMRGSPTAGFERVSSVLASLAKGRTGPCGRVSSWSVICDCPGGSGIARMSPPRERMAVRISHTGARNVPVHTPPPRKVHIPFPPFLRVSGKTSWRAARAKSSDDARAAMTRSIFWPAYFCRRTSMSDFR